MQVHNIRSNNVSFGYDPVVNAKLIKKLESSKKYKALNVFIEEMVFATNKAETELRQAEKDEMKVLPGLLASAIIPIKLILTDIIDTHFPELNYRQEEMESYAEEVYDNNLEKEKPDHWLNKITNSLQNQEIQEQAQAATNFIKTIFSQRFPSITIDENELTDALTQKYIQEVIEDENEHDIGNSTEADDESDIASIFKTNDKNEEVGDLEERIKIGKDSVFVYQPKTKSEKMGFESLGGLKELKENLMKEIVIPLRDIKQAKYNEEHYGIKMPNGILFYGPSGTGKTTITKRLSVEAGVPLLRLTGDSFSSEWVGMTEKKLGGAFDYAASLATEEKPVILLIDDVDGIIPKRKSDTSDRDRKLFQIFLDRLEEAPQNNIIVIAATNKYDDIDKAVLRRFRQQYFVGLPDAESRKSILKLKLNETDNGKKLANDEEAMNKIAKMTHSFPISALEDFINEARKKAQIDFYNYRDIELKDLEEIINRPESQNKKEKEDSYKTNATRKKIGF